MEGSLTEQCPRDPTPHPFCHHHYHHGLLITIISVILILIILILISDMPVITSSIPGPMSPKHLA